MRSVTLSTASKGRHNGSWVSNQARVAGSRVLIPRGPEGAPNKGHALIMWCTVCRLPHRHHSESVAPILARNKAVFAQPDLRRLRRTQALRGRSVMYAMHYGYENRHFDKHGDVC